MALPSWNPQNWMYTPTAYEVERYTDSRDFAQRIGELKSWKEDPTFFKGRRSTIMPIPPLIPAHCFKPFKFPHSLKPYA